MSLNRGPTVYRYDYPSQEMFPTKRTPSPKRGRDIKRRIEMPPSRGPDVGRREAVREVVTSTTRSSGKHDYSKVVVVCHNLPQDKSVHTLSNAIHHEFKHFGSIKDRWMNQSRQGDRNSIVVFFE
eukprot:sb/3475700/